MGRKKSAFSKDWIEQGARVKKLRERAGMSQRALSESLGYSTANTVYYWETGRSGINYQQLTALSALFGVDIAYITGEQEHRNLADLVVKSKQMLSNLSPEYIKEHDELGHVLLRLGYDLAILESENANIVPYIKRHIEDLQVNEIDRAITNCLFDYELLKEGFKK